MTESEARYVTWPRTIGGVNDEVAVPRDILNERRVFKMPGNIPEPGEPAEEEKLVEETYIPRKVGMPNSDLRVIYFAVDTLSEQESAALVWERLCANAVFAAGVEGITDAIPDSGELAETLREAAAGIRVNAKHPTGLATAESMRRTAQILGLIPTCPECQRWLIYRQPHERFMENSRYVQCQNGHIFEVVRITDLPKGKTATEVIQQLATGGDDLNKTQIGIARLFLEGRLYAGHESADGLKFEPITPPER